MHRVSLVSQDSHVSYSYFLKILAKEIKQSTFKLSYDFLLPYSSVYFRLNQQYEFDSPFKLSKVS